MIRKIKEYEFNFMHILIYFCLLMNKKPRCCINDKVQVQNKFNENSKYVNQIKG